MAKRRFRPILLLLATFSLALSFVLAEVAYRCLGPDQSAWRTRGSLYYRDLDGLEVPIEDAISRGFVEETPNEDGERPRFRARFRPGVTVQLCYRDHDVPWLDADGCVTAVFNSRAVREREELCEPKPPGQKRIVCIGDSFTFGWGVRAEKAWVRGIEDRLRAGSSEDIRTVNCGAAGALYVDEYWYGLRTRFAEFEPDVVIVALCLNDLLPINSGLAHMNAPLGVEMVDGVAVEQFSFWQQQSRLLKDLARFTRSRDRLALDPEVDWVQKLLDIPATDKFYALEPKHLALWSGGGPERDLKAMHAWCKERGIAFGVVIWPLFQGLDNGSFYPFAKMHALVSTACDEASIPCFDLLPAFRGQDTASLWVSAKDMHGNDKAQAIAADAMVPFVRELGKFTASK